MAAAKTIEIIGRSTTGSDDAVRQALDEARRTVRNITGVDVVSKGLRGDGLKEWRALVRVAFVVDRDETPGATRGAPPRPRRRRCASRSARARRRLPAGPPAICEIRRSAVAGPRRPPRSRACRRARPRPGRGSRGVYPPLLEAIGGALGWDLAAAWEIEPDETMACVETWAAPGVGAARSPQAHAAAAARPRRGPARPGLALGPGGARRPTSRGTASFPRAGPARRRRAARRGVLPDPRRPRRHRRDRAVRPRADPARTARCCETLASLGRQIGQAIERARAEGALRDSIARKSAILDAAFDCIITMDGEGRVVEVNAATERTFGYRAEAMVGRDLADLIVPEHLREAHRRGVRRYLETGHGRMLDHPLELDGQRADGSLFPVEVAITQPELDGPPLFTGFVRDVTDRRRADEALRALAAEQAALRRVATLVASEGDPRRGLLRRDRGGRPAARRAVGEHGPLRGRRRGVGRRRRGARTARPRCEVGGSVAARRRRHASEVVRRTGRPVRIDSYDGVPGTLAERLRALGFRCARRRADHARRAGSGAR